MAKRSSAPLRAIEEFEALEATLWDRTRLCFSSLEDPRAERGKRHPLVDVVLIALIAMICGADDADEIAEWAKEHQDWLTDWFELAHGTPSQDTFLRVFAILEPASLQAAFGRFVELLCTSQMNGQVAVDGKTLRGSFDTATGKSAIHMVTAWLSEAGLVLGQVKTDDKSNEITAIPSLLAQLRLKGCTVSIDAAGCQREIARVITESQGEYILAVKGNQPTLHDDILRLFREAEETRRRSADELERPKVLTTEHTDGGHGRIEKRVARVCKDLSWLSTQEAWPGLSAVGIVDSESTDELSGKVSSERRTFVASRRDLTAADLLRHVRAHWGIENQLHWVLDVDFGEDASRVRTGFAAENLGVIRRAALNFLRREQSYKRSLKLKRKRCGWNFEYLKQVLGTASTA